MEQGLLGAGQEMRRTCSEGDNIDERANSGAVEFPVSDADFRKTQSEDFRKLSSAAQSARLRLSLRRRAQSIRGGHLAGIYDHTDDRGQGGVDRALRACAAWREDHPNAAHHKLTHEEKVRSQLPSGRCRSLRAVHAY